MRRLLIIALFLAGVQPTLAQVSPQHLQDHLVEDLILFPAGDGPQAQPQRLYAPNREAEVKAIAEACPGLVLQDHAFTDAVATKFNQQDARWGRNGKRGNANDLSHDALFYRTDVSPFGGAVIDIILGAGGPNPSPGWQDVTDATIAAGTTGVWVAPSGVLPACLRDQPEPTPDPAPMDDVLVALSRVENRLSAIEAQVDRFESQWQHSDIDAVLEFVDDMVGEGPTGEMSPHVTDLKQRLDVIRVSIEQLTAWLRSRRVLEW